MKDNRFEESKQEFLQDYKEAIIKAQKGVFLFGAGKLGDDFYRDLSMSSLDIKGYVDNNSILWGKKKNGVPVVSLQEYMNKYNECLLLISVGAKKRYEILQQLREIGFSDKHDYIENVDVFLQRIEFYVFERLIVPLVQISLTERCTLNCEKCAHACNLVRNDAKDMEIEKAKKTIDDFFAVTDVCKEFVLIGGEPLLYKELPEIVEYIGNKYRDRIQVLSITTNATLMPSDELLKECRKNRVLFRISNYSKTLPYLCEKINRLKQALEDNSIEYILSDETQEWMDYGFDYYDRGDDPKVLRNAFNACRTVCHEIRDGRFYYCVMARAVSENMSLDVGQDDYLSIDIKENDDIKKKLFLYVQGCLPKGYLEMCRFCHGKESEKYPIPAAIQMKV